MRGVFTIKFEYSIRVIVPHGIIRIERNVLNTGEFTLYPGVPPCITIEISSTPASKEPYPIDLSIANGGPPIASYYWNFGDLASGSFNSSTLQNPTHKFSAPGTYGIMMVTTNTSGCPDTLRRNIEIHDSPIVNFNTTPGTQNNEVHFHAQADFSIDPYFHLFSPFQTFTVLLPTMGQMV